MLLVGREERAGRRRVGEPAAHEHLRERVADAQLAPQPQDVLGRAWGDLEAHARHAGETTASARRNFGGRLGPGRAA